MTSEEIAADLVTRIHAEAVEKKSDKYATPEEQVLIADIPDDLSAVPGEQIQALKECLLYVIDACQRFGYTIMPPLADGLNISVSDVQEEEE